ncbi:conserved hypothetical protein [Histoplasma capsulatum var. duboisii H88]|uniref:Pyridoxamine 5'-phosphate oxidase n=2 Tax=Ajellomyces capsulatus TaxID=5037 RepID=F0UN59_AJEC8|nr:conserved hypothetical protein [Histoplasma capsulatum H143]EGC47526.1 conserved hypothetical protein [Histoplasma capsulatum var. duboisii H88]QSS53694.1 pyridoxamine 5'-phosphate oxidase [Histoplasma capsulatum var. duboisii H88]
MVRRRVNNQATSPVDVSPAVGEVSTPEPARRKEEGNERGQGKGKGKENTAPRSSSSAHSWVVLAVASGLFAAMNGVFAKLTTTHLTTALSQTLSRLLSLSPASEGIAEYVTRALFFALNILSNGVMWALFTRALTASASSTKVTITNTTANFLLTALLGMAVFGEKVGGLWWVGAALMAAGCVIVGMREGATAAS